MMRREAHAIGSEPIQMGRARLAISVTSEDVSGVIVGEDKQKIRFASGLRGKRNCSAHEGPSADRHALHYQP
jgi:hypothetical protein